MFAFLNPTRISSLSPACLCLIALAAHPTDQDPFAHQARSGQSTTRTFHFESELELVDSKSYFDGEEQPAFGERENIMRTQFHLQVEDSVIEAEESSPTKVQRKYIDIYQETRQELFYGEDEQVFERTYRSLLEDSTVEFQRDGDDWNTAWPDGEEGDDDLIENLHFDLSLQELLPEDQVKAGDRWDIPVEVFAGLVRPGKELHLQSESDDARLYRYRETTFEGELQARFVGMESEGGVDLSVVELTYEVTQKNDPSEIQGYTTDKDGNSEIKPGTFAESNSWEGKGQFRWDPAAGRLHDVELSGELTRISETTMESDWGEGPVEIHTEMEMSGTTTIEISFE